MSLDEIFQLVRRSGAHDDGHEVRFVDPRYLEHFVALVRADQREIDAKVAEERGWYATAAAIRAKGQS